MSSLNVRNEIGQTNDATVRQAYADAERLEAYLPTVCVQNHAANLHALPNGDLLCVWFGGTQEGIPDVSIYMSRLAAGSQTWTPAQKLSDDPTRSEQNPVLFTAPDGALWLLYTAQLSGHQNTAIVRKRISLDNGATWSDIETLFDQAGTFVRQPITLAPDGAWLCPVFLCRTQPGERWVGNDDISAVLVSADNGNAWQMHEVPESTGCVHMNIHTLKEGGLVALYRSRWADNIYVSRSRDGRSWSTPQRTSLPNNNSSIQFTVLTNGDLAVVYNESDATHSSARRTSLYDDIEDSEDSGVLRNQPASSAGSAFWGAPRAPLSLALSSDGGKTWSKRRALEIGDGYCMTNNSAEQRNREYSYPSIVQTSDGTLHIAFTHFRQRIKYVRVQTSWVRGA